MTQDTLKTGRWSLVVRLLHWITVAVLGIQVVIAWMLMGDSAGGPRWIGFHISLGMVFAVIVAVRLLCRMFDRGPEGRAVAARMLQAGLYGEALAVALSGWLAYRPSPFAPRDVVFGYFELPILPLLRGLPWSTLHRGIVWLFIATVLGHALLAIVHALTPNDPRFAAMSLRRTPRTHDRR